VTFVGLGKQQRFAAELSCEEKVSMSSGIFGFQEKKTVKQGAQEDTLAFWFDRCRGKFVSYNTVFHRTMANMLLL